ncbi:hypothetical protein PAXRUDRAFT_13280 [Paxillus rubicundulus Ve08.2h10]|uniref:Uncharacterized protein n=1 Tax=Paxillus rubicundulus Ve08.2h10 TaxID=930991 RepID=A0A0D0D6B9_9AGAM|nr:hypothetical protein PAXRUDRAFT_13280 [Paxillus rubicundulus Ve08.2h10]
MLNRPSHDPFGFFDQDYRPDYTQGFHQEPGRENYSSFSTLCGAMGSADPNSSPSPSVNYPSPFSASSSTGSSQPVAPIPSTSGLPTMSLASSSAMPALTGTAGPMYGEVFVPMPSHGPRDRADWVERVRMGNRPVSNYLILFEPEVTAQPEHTNTSCPSVFMTDCILASGSKRTIMRDAEEPIFASMMDKGYQEITFILRWPGYSPLDWSRNIPIYFGDKLINRAQLAHCIANEFEQFVKVSTQSPSCHACDRGELHTTEPHWKVGHEGISFNRMKLSSIWNPQGNIWVASVRVVGSKGSY